jgi:hypothetical protein
MTTTVINIKSLPGAFPRDEHDVYIGRNMMWMKFKLTQSKWYNPYHVDIYNKDGTIKKKRDGTNLEVAYKYCAYLPTQRHLMASLPELKDKVLGCWCKPQACHGDVLVMYVNLFEKWTKIEKDPYLMKEKIDELLKQSEDERIRADADTKTRKGNDI